MRMVQRKQQRKFWLTVSRQFAALLCFLLLGTWSASGQGNTCGCADGVIVSLDENCNFELTVENVRAGTCPGGAMVIVDDGKRVR